MSMSIGTNYTQNQLYYTTQTAQAAAEEVVSSAETKLATVSQAVQKTDTVQISQEAKAAMAANQASATVQQKAQASQPSQIAQVAEKQSAVSETTATQAVTQAATASSEESSSANLSSLSEEQINKLVSAGTITKSQAAAELAKRAAAKQDRQESNVQENAVKFAKQAQAYSQSELSTAQQTGIIMNMSA